MGNRIFCLYTFASISNDSVIEDVTRMDVVYRLIPAMVFAVMSMFMLVPLQKIATNPTYAELRYNVYNVIESHQLLPKHG